MTWKRLLWAVVCVLTTVVAAQHAGASANGIDGFSGQGNFTCSQCHHGGVIPTVTINGPTLVTPVSTHTYTLTISGGQQISGGLDVSADGGTLVVADPGTHLQGGEITHNTPRGVNGNLEVVFTFNWTAPLSTGSYTLYGAGNSANSNGNTNGDEGNTDTLQITVVSAASTPGETSGDSLPPLLVTGYDSGTGNLSLSYGTACQTTSNDIYFGPLERVATYRYTGEDCDVGTSGTHTTFNPGLDSYFFLIVGTQDPDEGSYGRDSFQTERPAHTGSSCGQTQFLTNRCD
jgi:hypothetical protein